MYYHIRIDKEKKILKEIDFKSKFIVVKDILVPYLKREEFFFDGYYLHYNNITRINIYQTHCSANDIADMLNQEYEIHDYEDWISDAEAIDDERYTIDITDNMIREASKFIRSYCKTETISSQTIQLGKTKAFIVHGHDRAAQLEVKSFLTTQGINGIILNERVNAGQTIIEKIESNSDVGFAIILYTPCDEGAKKGEKLQPRARQNVVFEHGYFISKIGRENVCALVKGNVETQSDILGVVYTAMDDRGAWQLELAREMKNAGYTIDLNKLS